MGEGHAGTASGGDAEGIESRRDEEAIDLRRLARMNMPSSVKTLYH